MHAGAFGGGLEQHTAGAELSDDLMRNGGPAEGDGGDVLLGVLQALADGLGDFIGLAHAEADTALAVADYAQRGELCHTAALDGLADTVEGNNLFNNLGRSFFSAAALSSIIVISHFLVFPLPQNFRPASRAPSASAWTRP